MKTRLLGAAVLLALAALFLPMIFTGKSPTTGGDQSVSLAIPPAPDGDLQTRTMSLTPDAAVGTPAAAASAGQPNASVTPGSGDRLATVNIGSRRPPDVQTDAGRSRPPTAPGVTTGSGDSPSQPVIPMQPKPGSSPIAAKPTPAKPRPTPVAPARRAAATRSTSVPTPAPPVPRTWSAACARWAIRSAAIR